MALLFWRLPTTASINKALVRACCMYWGSWTQRQWNMRPNADRTSTELSGFAQVCAVMSTNASWNLNHTYKRSGKFNDRHANTNTQSWTPRREDVRAIKEGDISLNDIVPPSTCGFTLCWSAMLRPAHISLTIRFHNSVSVFKLASNASFRPRTRSFRLGIRSSRKGAEDTFTSYREKKVVAR